MKRAVFLDRDGVLIEDCGFIGDVSAVKFFPFTVSSLLLLQKHFELFIVSNQSGISTGATTVEEVETVNAFILDHLKKNGIRINCLYYCRHMPEDNCTCRKPLPYYANIAAEEFDIDLKNSFMIGDHPGDIQFAENFGGKGLFVLTGHGKSHKNNAGTDDIFPSLKEASDRIIEYCKL